MLYLPDSRVANKCWLIWRIAVVVSSLTSLPSVPPRDPPRFVSGLLAGKEIKIVEVSR
jgi:hypothetical protein